MKRLRYAILIALGAALAAVSFGQDQPAETQPSTAAPAPSRSEPAAPAGAAQDAAKSEPGATTPRSTSKDDDFIPSQEIQPDEEVTFPVDI